MDPNTQPPPSGNQPPIPQPGATPVPQPSAPAPASPPVFHNPLAAGHEAHTEQLPPLPVSPQPNAPTPPAPASQAPTYSPPSPQMPAPNPPPIQPAQPVRTPTPVSHLSDSIIKPAPVRLAPEPKADDFHADASAQTAGATPFGAVHTPPVATQAPAPVPAPKKKPPVLLIVGVVVAVVLVAGLGAAFLMPKKKAAVTPSTSTTPTSQRLTAEQPLQPFAQKVSTDCYVFQVPTPNAIQTNKDCLFSIAYGEQKTSTITVSPQREFDIVATDTPSNSSSPSPSSQTVRFDTEKYLEALIANSVPKELIATREKITVAGLEATKVVGKKEPNGSPIVAYVFIVLPEGDRQFNEKTFVAFIVTGAYNDDYSRKNFDQALTTWSWK